LHYFLIPFTIEFPLLYEIPLLKGVKMPAVATLSPKFQITIPSAARRALGLEAGRHLEVIVKNDRIELVPQEPFSSLRGLFKWQSSVVERDKDRV
jgi:AbrB family looped-hinge helix DNA binding protein